MEAVKHSLFELFKIGIGPSSSHTMGPMRAALRFVNELHAIDIASLRVDLYGSLALTGHGHGTDRAILLGLSGHTPQNIDPDEVDGILSTLRTTARLELPGNGTIPFEEKKDMLFHRDQMYPEPGVISHPNGMRFSAFDRAGQLLLQRICFSIGGGFIVSDEELLSMQTAEAREVPFPFFTAEELLERASAAGLTIAQLIMANECALQGQSEEQVRHGILEIWQVMRECTRRGMNSEGILPGGLNVRRRAKKLAEKLRARGSADPLSQLDWINVYAMAVNEENAAGGRVVTAPTNGAAGVVPAVAHYYLEFVDGANEEGILRYFLTAAAIGILYKENASISGAEVGCQGEVGVASSMAAGGLVAAMETTLPPAEINSRVEHAAEIGMEHHLGMTCDPIGGLVQVPCIERNAVGAIKAINASRMAMNESEGHKVSLDQVIKTMYETGLDMQARYKETSLAGLALNVIEC
jgi:L-serine dehydratase